MKDKGIKIYKVTDKNDGREFIGTTYQLAQDLYMAQASVHYIVVRNGTRDYKIEFLGYRRRIYKVSYDGEIFEGSAKEIADKFGFTEKSVWSTLSRQNNGKSTKLKFLRTKDIIVNEPAERN